MRIYVSLACVLGACVDSGDALNDSLKPKPPCVAIDDRSLIETDPAIVTEERFGLARVLEHIRLTTPGHLAVPSLREMFAQLYTAYSQCSGAGIDPHGYGIRCRAAEAQLAALDPFTGGPEALHFRPVAVVGRFDLASKKGDHCGESRIIYWKDRGPTTGKAGFIVELFTPPVIEKKGNSDGKPSCAPIASFWASLSAQDDPQVRATMLERFFYQGLPGMPFPPASARGAGWDGLGQLRANNFVDKVQWNLREAKWQQVCDDRGCRAAFVLVDSKNSPSRHLFAGTHPNSAAFEHWFLSKSVPRLARAATIHQLSLGNAVMFNSHEAISQPFDDDPDGVQYAQLASAPLRAKIAAKLVELESSLSVDNILDRATAVTCAGCHRMSRNADLGGGMVFPAPFFVHVNELGQLSAAMTDHFLPERRAILQREVCGNRTPDDGSGETLSGHVVGEPN